MATAKSLAKPKILAVDGSVIRIQHPDISNYQRTYLGAQIAAAGTAMTVLDNHGFADNDYFIVGEIGDEKTEENDVNGAVTRGTSLTVTNTQKFAHEVDAPVTRILERAIKIYGSASDGGTGTLIASVDAITTPIADAVMVQWGKPYTEYNLISTDTTYNYYFVKFTDGTTDSAASDYIPSTGLTSNSAEKIIQNALDITGAEISDAGDITWPFLIRSVQDWQDYVTQWVDPQTGVKKDWSWEYVSDNTSLTLITNENRYAVSGLTYDLKYPETKQAILNVRIGNYPTNYIPIDKFDQKLEGKVFSQADATPVGNTTLTVDDTSMFEDDGTLYCGGNTITYTSKDDATDTFSGIPASGDGSITVEIAAGATCWQENFGGRPTEWTIYDNYLLFTEPPSSDYSGWPIKVKYIKKLTPITEVSDTTEIPFFNSCQYYVAYKIELKRGNKDEASLHKSLCDQSIIANARSDKSYVTEVFNYYGFEGGTRRDQDWNSDVYYN